MAQLPPIKRFIQDDYAGLTAIPAFAGKLFYPLNLFLNAVYSALNNGLTLNSNTIGIVATQTSISTSSTGTASTTVNWPYLQSPPGGVVVMNCSLAGTSSTYPLISWSYAGGVVTISMQFVTVSAGALVQSGASNPNFYSITFWVSGG